MQNITAKKITCTVIFLLLISILHAQNVGIGTTTPAASAQLHINSINKGLLIPRLTTAQRTAIANPANGLMVYDTDTNSFWYYKVSVWMEIGAGTSGTGSWTTNGNDIYTTNTGAVGIGTSAPQANAKTTIQTADYSTALVLKNPSGTAALNAFIGGPANGNAISLGTPGEMPLALYTNSANRIVINANGNTGIGTDAANSKLEVNGSMSMPIRTINTASIVYINDDDYTLIGDCQNLPDNDISFVLPPAAGRKGRIYNITIINNRRVLDDFIGIVPVYNENMTLLSELYDFTVTGNNGYAELHRKRITVQSNGVSWFVISSDFYSFEDSF